MVKTFEGHLSARAFLWRSSSPGLTRLSRKSCCQDASTRSAATARDEDAIDVAWVPGAFEIPLVARKMAESGKYDAVICLGAVIRGATPHFDYVCAENAKGIAAVGH